MRLYHQMKSHVSTLLNTYLKTQTQKYTLISIIIISSFVIITLFNPIFTTLSLKYIQLKQQTTSQTMIHCYRLISYFGTDKIILPIIYIMFLNVSFNVSYTLTSVFFYSKYICNILKMITRHPRPFWLSKTIFITCHSGYSNPSSHCLTASAFYLSLTHIIIYKYKLIKNNIYIQIIIWLFTFVLLYLIAYSRVILAVHGIDQVCFGLIIGFVIYYYYFHINNSNEEINNVVYVHNITNETRDEHRSNNNNNNSNETWIERIDRHVLQFCGMFITMVIVYFVFYNKYMLGMYLETVKSVKCPIKRYGVKLPTEKSFVLCFNYLGVVGGFYALKMFKYIYDWKYIREYNDKMKDKTVIEKIIHYCIGWIIYLSIVWFIYKNRFFAFWFKVPCYAFICGFGLFGFIGVIHVVLFGWCDETDKQLDTANNNNNINNENDIFINIANTTTINSTTINTNTLTQNKDNDDNEDNENASLI